MSDEELEQLLVDLESDRSERTRSQTNTDKFGEAICAFANDLPKNGNAGYLFVGVDDRGQPTGDSITDKLLQDLGGIRAQGNLLPQPVINVFKRRLLGADVAVVEVFPSDLPPVRYKGTVWVRVGPRRARASEADERALSEKRTSSVRTWDARLCPGTGKDDLVIPLFEAYRISAVSKDVIDENHRSLEEQLASLRFLDRASGRPTNAAMILFGKDIRAFVPGAYVQYVRYLGTTAAADVSKERRFDGDLLSVLRELQTLADELSNARPIEVSSMQEVVVYDYPPAALREVFTNAIIHRDYESNTPVMITHFDDRIEIQNPGGLFGDISERDFPGATAYRNPVLAEAAKVYGFVNRFGRGVPRTQDSMKQNDSPPPQFEPKPRHFLVILGKRR